MGWAITLSVAGLLSSLAATLFVHETWLPIEVVLCAGFAFVVTLLVRQSWAHLPGFVTRWLDAGALMVALLVAVASTGFSRSLAYTMLIWPRTAGLLLAAGLLGLAVAGLASTHRRLERVVRAQTAQLDRARRAAVEGQLAALSAQVNPHFLFNTLNTLAEVVHEDEDQAEDLITDLAALLRHSLDNSTRRIPLGEELAVIRRLLRIEQARLGDRLNTELNVDPDVERVLIPGFLLQPLVENAVKHGVSRRPEGGRVCIEASVVDGRVHIMVADDGPGLDALPEPDDRSDHRGGLANVVERLRLSWPEGEATMTLEPGEGTRIRLDLPLEVT